MLENIEYWRTKIEHQKFFINDD